MRDVGSDQSRVDGTTVSFLYRTYPVSEGTGEGVGGRSSRLRDSDLEVGTRPGERSRTREVGVHRRVPILYPVPG